MRSPFAVGSGTRSFGGDRVRAGEKIGQRALAQRLWHVVPAKFMLPGPVPVESQRDLAVLQAFLGPLRFEVKGYVAQVSEDSTGGA